MKVTNKLRILADAAKYDASCASGGAGRDGFGNSAGICHAYTPDGRCVSLLKILLTNFCIYDCLYCINRKSSNVPRARFTVEEIVRLTLGFYRRNCVEGLFLSSGIIRNPDYTMEQIVEVARILRQQHGFRGYIHLKTIPDADPALLAEAGKYADRLSLNIELPSKESLARLAPEKDHLRIRRSMGRMRTQIEVSQGKNAPPFAPAGQSTRVIVGADRSSDRGILGISADLYASYGLRRVYYSAFSPIPDASDALPPRPAPLLREHRLYQADWLLRHYGFKLNEIETGADGNLNLEIDPKLAWALANQAAFPLDVNRASREALLRVPGLGVRTVERMLQARRHHRIRLQDLSRLRVPIRKVRPFVITPDHRPRPADTRTLLASLGGPGQRDLFAG